MKELADLLHKKIIENFVLQGHNLTGTFVKTLNYNIEQSEGFSIITFYGQGYAKRLDTGLKPSQIPIAGGGAKTYISGLIDYAKLRFGSDSKESKKIAFLIWRKHQKEGMPTKASYQFSQTGKRTQFITDVLKSDEVKDILQKQIGYTIQNKINEFNDKKQTSTEVSFSM